MALQVTIEVQVAVNGRALSHGANNVFQSAEEALASTLVAGVAEGVRAKLESLCAGAAPAENAPQAAQEPATATNDPPEGSEVARDETSPSPAILSDEDRAALAHAESLRNALRASRAASVASAAADAESEGAK